ncbi:PREDICTED: probable BOI-related E3 ubiquitin-protein ligase 3 [Ipomoea nil]|uniref:probable BOI-related E3 ubiquitin-protein ligase 3 n=1 Tax=Ipomoea nil TaxID=35883 RepID=UPI000900D0ED|nr:PREDICTED: probable BOI-related E3 ubiquitin-protein ligase 3 [Ipomoea nil]
MAVEANSNILLLPEFSDFIPLGDFMNTKPRLAGQSILPFNRSRPPVKTAVNGSAGNSHRLQVKRSRDSLHLYNPSPVFASAKNTQIVKHHAKKVRMELEERQKEIGEGMVKKLREKDEEIQRMKERVKSLYVENHSLRTNLEQVLAHVAADERVSCPAVAPVEEDAESCCGSTDHGRGESSVLLLPCRHLCLCTVCGSSLVRCCPVCNSNMSS